MASREVQDLSDALIRLKLLTQQQMNECLVGPAATSREALLDVLERKGWLTSLQSTMIKKGEIEDIVLGPYALLYRNASGSFARVYRAKDLRTGQMVGLKVLRSRYTKNPRDIVLFRREAELGKTLKHDNIVPIYEVAQHGDEYYLAMEFVEGGNLRDFLKIRRKLTPAEATRCILDIANGLQYALEKGLTHRDLKLTNVLMSTKGVAKLVDFGLAGVESDAVSTENSSESAQRAIEYATLEKNTGVQRNDPRSDLFFLGIMYYELLSGQPPLPRTRDINERAVFANYSGIKPIRQFEPDLAPGIVAVVEKLLQVNARLRYQTPGEAASDLREVLADPHTVPTLAAATLGSTSAPVGDNERPVATTGKEIATILCLESRPKHQDVLRNYFTKHGYRVLMMSDLQRGAQRIKSSPPAAVVIMADSFESFSANDALPFLQQAAQKPLSIIILLGVSQKKIRDTIHVKPGTSAGILVQPLTLRELHKQLRKGLKSTGHLGDDTGEDE